MTPSPANFPASRSFGGLGLIAVIWLAAVGSVVVWMSAATNRPGPSGTPPAAWPVETRLALPPGRPTLLVFAHPRCPCTTASLGELEKLLAHAPAALAVQVLFLKPEGTAADWAQTDLWRQAAALPGVTLVEDAGGVEARRFHSETSGQTVLYDARGRLLFHGGITLSRGHAGDNPGASAIEALLRQPAPGPLATPVFGCALFATDQRTGGAR